MDSGTLQSAIDDALTHTGIFANGWALVVEQVDEEGERFLLHETSEDMADWTRTGMLYAAIGMSEAMYNRDAEDDE